MLMLANVEFRPFSTIERLKKQFQVHDKARPGTSPVDVEW
jgi:hypothetical protein